MIQIVKYILLYTILSYSQICTRITPSRTNMISARIILVEYWRYGGRILDETIINLITIDKNMIK